MNFQTISNKLKVVSSVYQRSRMSELENAIDSLLSNIQTWFVSYINKLSMDPQDDTPKLDILNQGTVQSMESSISRCRAIVNELINNGFGYGYPVLPSGVKLFRYSPEVFRIGGNSDAGLFSDFMVSTARHFGLTGAIVYPVGLGREPLKQFGNNLTDTSLTTAIITNLGRSLGRSNRYSRVYDTSSTFKGVLFASTINISDDDQTSNAHYVYGLGGRYGGQVNYHSSISQLLISYFNNTGCSLNSYWINMTFDWFKDDQGVFHLDYSVAGADTKAINNSMIVPTSQLDVTTGFSGQYTGNSLQDCIDQANADTGSLNIGQYGSLIADGSGCVSFVIPTSPAKWRELMNDACSSDEWASVFTWPSSSSNLSGGNYTDGVVIRSCSQDGYSTNEQSYRVTSFDASSYKDVVNLIEEIKETIKQG